MPKTNWTQENALLYWKARPMYLLFRDEGREEKKSQYVTEKVEQRRREEQEKVAFLRERDVQPPVTDVFGHNSVTAISADLKFWAENCSWCYCEKCYSLSTVKLMPSFSNKKRPTRTVPCPCSTNRYIIPRMENIPVPLRNLSKENIWTLRPFDIDCGVYQREPHGYRVKTGMTNILACETSVDEKIAQVTCEADRQKCQSAYDYLMQSQESSYAHFVQLREQLLRNDIVLNTFDLEKTKGIECALWPNLYPFTEWCESILCGKTSRLSVKVAFMVKVRSELLDYSIHFDLLQYQYDRWLYKVVSGAINSAQFSNCSPARALDTKTFSPTYWQWQHRFLLDAVAQFGWPDLFVTLSPFEWTFPFPTWLNDLRQNTGKGPTQLAAFETQHIAHVLEQTVRGYLCGSNSNRWTKHVFSYNRIATTSNVKTYFYRLEFQKRGTVHLHLLVWLRDVSKIQHQLIRADIPTCNEELAFLVNKLQPSDKPSYSLRIQESESYLSSENGKTTLHLKHPAHEFALNLRAYISTLMPMLKCSMDFQTTNGKSMLLRYVTSYVTKSQDAISIDSLYSYRLQGRQAAVKHLITTKPAEPEMWLALTSMKVAWTPSRTKRFTVPTSETVSTDKTVASYWKRHNTYSNHTLTQWLRAVNANDKGVKSYKSGTTLLGLKTLSIFNSQHFFQYMLLNLPHRNVREIAHPLQENIPERLKWFAACVFHCPDLWKNDINIRDHMELQGHRDCYITTILSYAQSLRDLLHLWQTNIISAAQLHHTPISNLEQVVLDGQQLAVKQHIEKALRERARHYDFQGGNLSEQDSSDDENTTTAPPLPHVKQQRSDDDFVWQKTILLTGKPGAGKSLALRATIEAVVPLDMNVLVASPTGFLSTVFKAELGDDVTCETVHSAFQYPVNSENEATVNWTLSRFDLIIIDEVSMIPNTMFNHVMSTVNKLIYRPVFVVCGDAQQQQPFSTTQTRIVSVPSPLNISAFMSSCYRYNLTGQHRVGDVDYLQFLDHIRNWKPTQTHLDHIQQGRVICKDGNVTALDINKLLEMHHDIILLTFTNKAANTINEIVSKILYENVEPLAIIQMDCELPPLPIYKGMRVTITQNRDKENGVVNGQTAVVQTVQNKTLFVALPNGNVVAIYCVTTTDEGQLKCFYPIRMAYATTMCKAQGQTLKKVALWFDVPNIPAGTAYVALSRVKRLDDVYFLTPLTPDYFTPVSII